MKKANYFKYLIVVLFLFFSMNFYGQMLEPEDPGGDPVSEPPLGGGAPVDGGLVFLIGLGIAYGGGKLFTRSSNNN